MLALYRAAASGHGLARYPDELSEEHCATVLARAASDGISIGAFFQGQMLGEIHAWRLGPRKFDHVLGDLTVAVDPAHQGKGVGRALFDALFDFARSTSPSIERIELFVHDGNPGARRLYESLGFQVEGRMPRRLKLDDGRTFDDFAMAKILG
jgi:putative acetyltransferase